MSQRKIAAGVLVKHETYGVGLVYTRNESGVVEVDFGGGEPHRMAASVAANLKVLSEDGLESRLWHSAAATEAWANEAPLKLLAAALVDIGESATTPRLKERLGDLIVENVGKRWNSWWEPVKATFDDSKHFIVKKNKKGSFEAVSLANGVNVDDVPAGFMSEAGRSNSPTSNTGCCSSFRPTPGACSLTISCCSGSGVRRTPVLRVRCAPWSRTCAASWPTTPTTRATSSPSGGSATGC